jgi:DNA-binding response OmpR family regulator
MTQQQAGPAPVALVVEDEVLLALAMEDLLIAEGFQTILAHTEAEAEMVASDHLTVAIVDLRLASQLSGQRIIRFLRRRIPNLPVVVVTGYYGQAPEADLRGLGMPTVRLQKPVHYTELARAVHEVIARVYQNTEPPSGRRRSDRRGE